MKLLHNYKIQDNVNVYYNGENEVRFRKGIWNYEEATLDLSWFENDLVKKAVIEIINELADGKIVDIADYHAKYSLSSDDNSCIIELLDALSDQEYLNDGSNEDVDMLMKYLIGGTVPDAMLEQNGSNFKQVMLVSDSEHIENYLKELAKDVKMNLTILGDEEKNKLETSDITSCLNAIPTIEKISELSTIFDECVCVVVCLENPHIRLLRNLNRILLHMGKPLVLSLLDGPFISLMTIKGNETACYECFENRVMARLLDIPAYRNFVKETGGTMKKRNKTYATPILQTMASVALFEALLYANVNKAKMAGRLLNIYVPLMEIQVQDLLRVPFCPACGHIAKASYEEMYTSSKQIVNKLIDTIEIVD